MIKRKFIIASCSLLLSIFLQANASEISERRLTLLTENYGKFNFSLSNRQFEHDGKYIGGSSTAFLKKLLARAEIPYKMKLRTWQVSYERTLERANYGVFSTGRTDIREDLFEWIGPIAQYNWIVFAKKGSNLKITSLDDLKKLHVGGYNKSGLTQFIESQGITVSKPATDAINPKKLHEGLIDVWISSDATAWDLAKEAGYEEEIEVAYVIKTVDMYLAMNKETKPEWLKALRESYNELVSEGALTLPTY